MVLIDVAYPLNWCVHIENQGYRAHSPTGRVDPKTYWPVPDFTRPEINIFRVFGRATHLYRSRCRDKTPSGQNGRGGVGVYEGERQLCNLRNRDTRNFVVTYYVQYYWLFPRRRLPLCTLPVYSNVARPPRNRQQVKSTDVLRIFHLEQNCHTISTRHTGEWTDRGHSFGRYTLRRTLRVRARWGGCGVPRLLQCWTHSHCWMWRLQRVALNRASKDLFWS